jgi:hypothetical protein
VWEVAVTTKRFSLAMPGFWKPLFLGSRSQQRQQNGSQIEQEKLESPRKFAGLRKISLSCSFKERDKKARKQTRGSQGRAQAAAREQIFFLSKILVRVQNC